MGYTGIRGVMSEFGMLPRRLKIEATNPAYLTRLNYFQHTLTVCFGYAFTDDVCCRELDEMVIMKGKSVREAKRGEYNRVR